MKKSLKIISMFFVAGMVMASCEGPMGPAGADGAKGDKGDKGDPGTPGTTLACAECHNNDDELVAFSAQWSESQHATGGNAAYANRTGCVQCHTHQGFLEYVAEGSAADISVPVNPMQINCYTCHKIHQTYTAADLALTKPGQQTLDVKYNGADVIWNKGNSNQCVACHQERVVSPAPVYDGPDFAITSARIGPHHAPMANLVLGKHPFELPGTAHPTANPHSTASGCLTCHMSTPYGYQAGGHNMGVWYDSHGTETMLMTGCTTCHTNSTTLATLLTALRADVEGKLADLEAQLIAADIYNPATGLAKTGTYKANVTLAYLNYNTVKEDRSKGIHNPGYIKVLLDNSIAEMVEAGFPVPGK
ncbi:MAG: collagen-like protein [Bacteroidales bacterium]|nr:collagen-like protein [Bacteroidales bacterium]